MPADAGINGVFTGSHSTRQTAYEGISAMGCITETESRAPYPPPYQSDSRLRCSTPLLEKSHISHSGGVTGGCHSQKGGNHGCESHGLGCHSRGQSSERQLGLTTEGCSHKLARIASSISSTETLPSPVEKPPCSDQNRQHHCCGVHQQTGRVTVPSFAHAGSQTDHVEQHQSVVTESYSHSRSSELGSRLNVQGKPAVRGRDPAPTCGDPNLDPLWPPTGRSVCLEGERSVSTVFLPEGPGGSARGRRISSQLATCSALCVPSTGLNFSHSNQSERERADSDIDRPKVDEVPLVSGDYAPLVERTLASPSPSRPSLPSQGGDFSPSSRAPHPVGLARERLNLSTAGLPQGVIATIQSARAPSTRSLYENKWRVFEEVSHSLLSVLCENNSLLSPRTVR